MKDPGCRILLTFAGLKPYVARALLQSDAFSWVGAVDANRDAIVREAASFFQAVPMASDPTAYLQSLEEVCRSQGVSCIVSLNDRDIVLLADHAPRFARLGVRVLGVPASTARVLEDKHAAATWLRDEGFASPQTVLGSEPPPTPGRVVVKARTGQGSEGYRVLEEGLAPRDLTADFVMQPFVEGDQYVLDVLADADGDAIVIPKKRLRERDGDMTVGVFVEDRALVVLGKRLARAAGLVGVMDVDVVRSRDEDFVLDVNPRVGGGFPFTTVIAPGYVDALGSIGTGGPVLPTPVSERRAILRVGNDYAARAAISE